jgi:hypothetical protein
MRNRIWPTRFTTFIFFFKVALPPLPYPTGSKEYGTVPDGTTPYYYQPIGNTKI